MKTLFYLLLLIPFVINAQKPKLIGNFNLDIESNFKAAKINNKVIFHAFTNTYGKELWVTDGTSAGTTLLKDFAVGTADSFFNRNFSWNGELYFTAYSNTIGDELWKTDGTPLGTVLVADVVPGNGSSSINSFATIGANLYFLASDNNYTSTLYKYDGSTLTVVYQNARSTLYSNKLIATGGTLYFEVIDNNTDSELWKSDGTALGTSLVKSFPSYNIQEIGKHNTEVFFTIEGATREIWKSNGTALGTVFIAQTNQTYGKGTDYFQESNGQLYFADNNKVYKYASGEVSTVFNGTKIKHFKCTNTDVFFIDEVFLNQKLYITNGINAPILLKELNNGSQNDEAISIDKTSNGTIFMSLEDEASGHEIWKTDGTALGTVLVKDIVPNNLGSFPKELIAVNNQVIFFAKTKLEGYEPWLSDGTSSGTFLIKNVQEGVLNATPRRFIVNGNTMHFSADKSLATANAQLFDGLYSFTSTINQSTEKILYNSNVYSAGISTNGTGVELASLSPANIYPINPGASSSFPANFKVFNNKLYFAATHDVTGRELWVFDGTAPTLFLDLISGTNSSNPYTLTVMGSNLYYFITNNLGQTEIVKTNGTLANTSILLGANGPDGMLINSSSGMVAIGSKLFFTAKRVNSSVGFELYVYNGTNINLVTDLVPGIGDATPSNLFRVGINLFFTANTPSTGRELYRYNDTDGTTLVKDINTGAASSSISEMFEVSANLLYFQANTNADGYEAWRSDGTPGGTFMIKDINTSGSSFPSKFCKLGSWVYFSANDGKHSNELWRTDGSTNGTTLVFDFNPDTGQNQNNGLISDITATATRLYISADNGRNGHQLFEYSPCQILFNNPYIDNSVANMPSETTHFSNTLYLTAKFYENRNLSFFSEKSIEFNPGLVIDATKNQVFIADIKGCY